MSDSVEDINRKLDETYGRDIECGLVKMRVVWSSSQYEMRSNPDGFDIYGEEGIFLRTEFGVKEVEKYPLHPDLWVLEVLTYNVNNPTLHAKMSYEPLWVFGAANSSPTPLWRPIKLLVEAKLKMNQIEQEKKSEADMFREEEERMRKEKEKFKDMIKNDSPYLATSLANHNAVTVVTDNLSPKENTNVEQ